MKNIFSYFLIVYFLTLTLIPCPDKVVHAECGSGMHEMIHQDQHGNDDHQNDCCSPLCTCSCCSLSFEPAKIFIVTQAFSRPKTFNFFFKPQMESHYDFSIWEPPKA